MEATIPSDKIGFLLKSGLFIFLVIAGLALFSPMLLFATGYLISAAGGTFAAAAMANLIVLRVFERAPLSHIGLNWHIGALCNLVLGFASGTGAALLILLTPLTLGFATLERLPQQQANPAAAAFVTFALLFGAIGEEMLFRGYGFQIAITAIGRIAAVVLTSLFFGWAHLNNQNVSWLGLVNTIGFGIVLGYAYVRSGDLWLPIGIHFGWNWIFPLFGINLSGFTMEVTGHRMRWNLSDLWSGGAYGPEASIPVCGIIVALLWFLSHAPISSQIPPLSQPRT